MEEQRKRRSAAIGAALRNSNYRVAESQTGKGVLSNLFCECGSPDCRRKLSLSIEDYDRVRAHDRRFFVVSGHEDSTVETLVEEHEGWSVVEKP